MFKQVLRKRDKKYLIHFPPPICKDLPDIFLAPQILVEAKKKRDPTDYGNFPESVEFSRVCPTTSVAYKHAL